MLELVNALIAKEEAFLPKFAPGTSQHSLLTNRIAALRTVQALLTGERTPDLEELAFALPRIESIVGKLSKAARVGQNAQVQVRVSVLLQAMERAGTLIRQAIARTEMTWLDEVRDKARRRNQLLFHRDSILLRPLAHQLERSSKQTVIAWALACAGKTAEDFARTHPEERLLTDCIHAAQRWVEGEIRLPEAKQAILTCHALAKTMADPADSDRCHAVAQACSVIHTPKHALGLPVYELTAIVRELGVNDCREAVEARCREYEAVLAAYLAAEMLPMA